MDSFEAAMLVILVIAFGFTAIALRGEKKTRYKEYKCGRWVQK